jgi:hypothetical protein
MTISQFAARALYIASSVMGRPTKGGLDYYFRQFPDAYAMARNGDARFAAIAGAIEQHVGPVGSLLDVACFEGYALDYLGRRLGAERLVALDISDFALHRTRERLAARTHRSTGSTCSTSSAAASPSCRTVLATSSSPARCSTTSACTGALAGWAAAPSAACSGRCRRTRERRCWSNISAGTCGDRSATSSPHAAGGWSTRNGASGCCPEMLQPDSRSRPRVACCVFCTTLVNS